MKHFNLAFLLALSLTFSTVYSQEKFKFAQITDIHISGHQSLEWFKASIEQINGDSTLDFVLVTGDLTDNGDSKSLIDFEKTLSTLNKPYYTITGNHETTWSESGLETFSRLFHSERISFTHKGYQFLGFTTGPFLRMAFGHVQPQDLSWISQEVKAHGQGKRLIIVTHYPLQEGDVDNWYQATDSLRKYDPLCCIGGHYHQNLFLSYDGIPGILGRSNLKDKKGNIGYTVYEMTNDSMLVFEQPVGKPTKEWASISLTHKYYDPQGKAVAYPNYTVNQHWSNVKEQWKKESGVGIYCSPVVSGNFCYIGNTIGQMMCYKLNSGKLQWTFQGGGKIIGTAAIAKNIVIFGSTDHNIYGVNAKTGKLIWKIPTDEAQMGCISVKGTTAFVAGSDHKMRAIEIKTGREIWTWTGIEGYVVCKPLIWDGKIIFGAWDNTVYALDQKTGQKIWTWEHMKRHMHYSAAGVWPVANKKAVFIVDPERAMTAIDLKTGRELWRTKQSKVRESLGMSADKKRLFAKTMQDSIVCYEARTDCPKELWATNAGFGYEHATTMLPVKDGIVYSSTKDGLVIALNDKTGKMLWKHKVGNSFINTVTPIGKGKILMTETSGEIVLIDASKVSK